MTRAEVERVVHEALAEFRAARDRVCAAEARIAMALDAAETTEDFLAVSGWVVAELRQLERETSSWIAARRFEIDAPGTVQ